MNPDSGADDNLPVQDSFDEGPNFCDLDAFNQSGGNGGPCSPIEPEKPCFLLCDSSSGGCYCVAGPKGTGIWQCTVDDSCMPKCAPMDDCGLDGGMFADTGPFDTGVDGAEDAPTDAEAKDVVTDAVHEAATDATKDSP
jgi:hypothetical protein